MKKTTKRTKKTISQDIITACGLVTKRLIEIEEITEVTKKLTGEYSDLAKTLIEQYKQPIIKIRSQNYNNFENAGWKWFDQRFNKPYIVEYYDRVCRDLRILKNISETLLNIIDDGYKAECYKKSWEVL